MIDKSTIDPNALHYYRMLKGAGFSAYFVGGSVRDLLLGKLPKDFDIATNATPHQIKRIIPQGRIIGRRFRHVMLERDGGRYEIVTFRGPIPAHQTQDASDAPLSEEQEPALEAPVSDNIEQDRRFPDLNQFGNAQQDALRRDFTINALFYDPDADELVDYVEGKIDIDQKLIRSIGDAKARMEEDPIRILRAIRHKTKLELNYDPQLVEAIQEKAPLLEQTSKDRIREEYLKICNDRSLGQFLMEAKALSIQHYVAPWFDGIEEASWEQATKLWQKFADTNFTERPSVDMGLALMMTPLIEPLVLAPYKASIPEGSKNYLPDMKYFLSCEPLRNYFLRNLRVSRAQTDHIVRALFYWSRMIGLWIENGPPRRVIGRLFQHPPALLAAKMARIHFALEGKDAPPWLIELAEFNPRERQRGPQPHPAREPREPREVSAQEEPANDNAEEEALEEEESVPQRLAPPDQPMVWNGPLHAPVLRPIFSEELPNRWARKNQSKSAYRPSGIPNQPTDYATLKSHLVSNYKPEMETPSRGEESHNERRGNNNPRNNNSRRNDRNKRSRPEGRNQEARRPNHGPSGGPGSSRPSDNSAPAPHQEFEEDSIGNILHPGEQPTFAPSGENDAGPAHLPAQEFHDGLDEDDDNIGNRLDAPPTSGHVGINGEGVLGRNNNNNRNHRPGQNHGPQNNNNRNRRGGRRHGRSGGGPNRNFRGGGGGGNAGSTHNP